MNIEDMAEVQDDRNDALANGMASPGAPDKRKEQDVFVAKQIHLQNKLVQEMQRIDETIK